MEARPITAFVVPGLGLYQFTRIPYGLSYAGATFERLIDKVIGPEMELYASSYLDDIIIATPTFEEHARWLRHILKRINEADFTNNCEKSVFGKTEVRYLGILVNHDCFRSDPEKIRPIIEYLVPRNLKQLRRFLVMALWYCKSPQDLATIAKPLTSITKKGRKYEWSETHQAAFEAIKALIASASILAHPDFDEMFALLTDASDSEIGTVLKRFLSL